LTPENNHPNSHNGNKILAALSKEDYGRLIPKLEQVSLDFGKTIYEPGEIMREIYFPNSGIITLLAAVENGATLEVGIVGREGVVGLPVFLGVNITSSRAIVHCSGFAMRIKAADFLEESRNGGGLPNLLQRFTYTLLAQVSQSAACYRFHAIEARLARWLLMTADRVEANDFQITQEFLSNMLGVRREAVNRSAVVLQQQGLIQYSRGRIRITDRTGLEKATCACYRILKDEEKSFPAINNGK
jgi:CRP-like cAMP-binding protein